MKLFAFAAVSFCLLIAVHLSLEIPQLVDCPDDFLDKNPSYATECAEIICPKLNDGRDNVMRRLCGEVMCFEGTDIKRTEVNHSRTYPDCCSRIISCGSFLLYAPNTQKYRATELP